MITFNLQITKIAVYVITNKGFRLNYFRAMMYIQPIKYCSYLQRWLSGKLTFNCLHLFYGYIAETHLITQILSPNESSTHFLNFISIVLKQKKYFFPEISLNQYFAIFNRPSHTALLLQFLTKYLEVIIFPFKS